MKASCHGLLIPLIGLGLTFVSRSSEAAADVSRVGEVVVVRANSAILSPVPGSGVGLKPEALAVISRAVLEQFGDSFDALTVWTSFKDVSSSSAFAYQVLVKNDVRGIGLPLRDRTAEFGSGGNLHSIVVLQNNIPGPEGPSEAFLSIWGQEAGHRWLMYLDFIHPRTGRISDGLKGRSCSHYRWTVDSGASVMDGFGWADRGSGVYSVAGHMAQYGELDLYAMGLLAVDELHPIRVLENVPGYIARPCASTGLENPPGESVQGDSILVTADSIVEANGVRMPSVDQTTGYEREAEVLVVMPDLDDASIRELVDRIDIARNKWEQWVRAASRHRKVVCTRSTADCGDGRSDVNQLQVGGARTTAEGLTIPIAFSVVNQGTLPAPHVTTSVALTPIDPPGSTTTSTGPSFDVLAPGGTERASLNLLVPNLACGTEVKINVTTQSDYHQHRNLLTTTVGSDLVSSDDFENAAGWHEVPGDARSGGRWSRPDAGVAGSQFFHGGSRAWLADLPAQPQPPRAVLESRSYVLDDRSTWFEYWVTSADSPTSGPAGECSSAKELRVEVTDDPGRSSVVDTTTVPSWAGWQRHRARVPGGLLGKAVRFRFVASAVASCRGSLAIDDFALYRDDPLCAPSGQAAASAKGCGIGAADAGLTAWCGPGLAGASLALVIGRHSRRKGTRTEVRPE